MEGDKGAFDEYEVIKHEIDRSKISRVNWKALFGESLTKVVAAYVAKEYTAEAAYNDIVARLARIDVNNPELLRRLKIGVSARFGEIRSESDKIRLIKLINWRQK